MPFKLPKLAHPSSLLFCLCSTFGQNIKADSVENLLDMSFESLLEMNVVSAAKQHQKLAQVAASIAVITDNQIKRRGYRFLSDALADLPGIDIVRLHGAYPDIMAFRGSYGDENKRLLLLIDGVDENSLNGSFEMGGYAYSLHNVERIEVIWGPGSALYGANALSGIINIITKHNHKENDGTSLSRGIASYDSLFDTFSYHQTKENFALSFSASNYSSDGPKFSNRHPNFTDAYADNVKSMTFRASLKQKNAVTQIGGHLYDSPMGDGTFAMSPTAVFGLPSAGYQNSGNGGFLNTHLQGKPGSLWHPYSKTLFIKREAELSPQWSWQGKLYHRETGVDSDSYSYIYLGDRRFRQGRWMHQSKRLGMDLQFNYKNREHSWITGAQYLKDDLEKGYRATVPSDSSIIVDETEFFNLNSQFAAADRLKQNNLGFFSQYISQVHFNGHSEITLGVRYDDNQSYGSSTSPRLGLVNKPTEDSPWLFKINYGEAFRAPAVFERFSASAVRVANPDLKPETVKSIEISALYQFTNASIQSTLFNNHLTDVITAVLLEDGKNQNQNVGSIRIEGVDIRLENSINKRMHLLANYTYQNAKQRAIDAKFSVPNVARHKANIGLDYLLDDNTSLYLNVNWVGSRTVARTNPLGKVDGYLTANISINKTNLFFPGLDFSWAMKNIADKHYVDPGIRSADGQGIFATVHEQPGRNYHFEVSYSF